MPDGWPAIADHGLIGDLRTCALVGTNGTIDWFCSPRFDSPSVFGAILDEERGGCWQLSPIGEVSRTQQFYFPDTAVLITRFLTPDGVAEVHDFMPVLGVGDPQHRQRVVRRVSGVRGKIQLRMRVDARPDYGRQRCHAEDSGDGVLITGDGVRLGLIASVDLTIEEEDDNTTVTADVELTKGDTALFVLEILDGEDLPSCNTVDLTDSLLDATTSYWRSWLSQSRYVGRWREMVHRSAITLKLLTHEPTGAVVAAPTTSIPEFIGGSRNWDYRYVWVRDAGFSLYALLRLGFTDEAKAFIGWLSERLGEERREKNGLGPLRWIGDHVDIVGRPSPSCSSTSTAS